MKVYAAPGGRADTLAVAFFPWGGNDSNSADRYREVAKQSAATGLAGVDVATLSAPGTGKVFIDRASRRYLKPGRFQYTNDLFASSLAHYTQYYRYVIGWGDSARAIDVVGMALAERSPFDAVLLRDGINLHAPESAWNGLKRAYTQGGRRLENDFDPAPIQEQTRSQKLYSKACALSEAITHAGLLASRHGVQLAYDLARQPDIPAHIVTLEHGICGDEAGSVRFGDRLLEMRQDVVDRCAPHERTEAILVSHMPGWAHGNLMDPMGAVEHLWSTRDLLLDPSLD